ncbi:MAG TPA: ChuX/HutX family heme-like substrate-binding protein [Kofleriaceae bacterium]|nr:ChuX/HutX family heme-like substrate-binding protein [Kofleriaceae bacterium]
MTALAAQWQRLRTARPQLRTRDAAVELGVSEAELIATTVGATAVRLADDAAGLLHALPEVGRCMALTRNEAAVSEVRGRYGGVELGAHAGQVVGTAIDLRVFLAHWRHLFAIDEPHPQRAGERRRSIHAFDRAGAAVHKIYLEPDGDAATWDAIVATRTVAGAPIVVEPAPVRKPERPDAAIDRAALVAGWDAMTDTHEFFHLLGTVGASRTQALRLAGDERARAVRGDALDHVLHDAAETGERIMIFVGNRGCIQVFSGAVRRVVRHGPWLNVLDPGFNLHLRTDLVAASWVVGKPTRTGVVSSLELYDAAGETIALVFRKRDDRERAEDPRWRAVLDRLAPVPR